jgi:hypothetical protein
MHRSQALGPYKVCQALNQMQRKLLVFLLLSIHTECLLHRRMRFRPEQHFVATCLLQCPNAGLPRVGNR